jgi:hypothetical protein
MLNPLYPRTVSINRQRTTSGASSNNIGLQGYSGAEQNTDPSDLQGEVVLYSGLAASIQATSTGRKVDGALPADAVVKPSWYIFLASTMSSPPINAIRDRDLVYDDAGYRYEVGQAEFNVTSWRLSVIRLEA